MVRRRIPLTMEGCGDSTPNLCNDAWCTLRAQIEKCSQVFSELYLSRQPFSPKETSVCHELSSVSCYMVAERSGLILDNSDRTNLGAAQVGDGATEGALESAMMQERQARAEAEQRLSVALGEVGGCADTAVATAAAGASPTPVSVSSSSMMGCIDTRLLGKPDKFDGQDSCWRDWKFITKAYIQAALPDCW